MIDFALNFLCAYLCYTFASFVNHEIGTAKAFVIVCLLCLFTSFLYQHHNLYAPMRTKRTIYYVTRIFLVNTEIVGVSAILIRLFGTAEEDVYIAWLVSSVILSFIVLAAKKIVMISVLHGMRVNKKNLKHILLVTDSQEMADAYMEEILNNPQFGYSVIGYVGNVSVIGLPHLGTTGDLDRILKEYRPDEVVMAFDTVRKKLVTKYISICNDNCAKTLVMPTVCGYFKSPRQINVIGNLPIIDIRSTPLDSLANRTMKRALDIVGSLLLMILTSPLMLFAVIGVKLSSRGPILFRQTRVGRNNREFTMYKFRSMTVNNEEATGWSHENDVRVTRFGAFIRKFAIDELPQLYNVLIGDMSLVGPRPEVPYYVEIFRKQVPLYMLKHTLRPGITGQAQIKGLRGDTSIQARIEEDINYIENWTFWGDIRILLLTPFKAVNRHERYAKRDLFEQKKMDVRGKREIIPDEDAGVEKQNGEE